ncbi:unnamed protein product [Spirodela intermedia]|uniref:Uncharacterized protein n=2 Tax=Spirodela intermedia TaxID=51605 RepID=A0A7I8LAV9_SPIIN|nr:unnamed protein product [Spirodela intermedia]CAA6669438.1 unnamed protein product [Spirodela intermedia]CAA7406395.1 unnamed protein product [Spirodela intermedia]
MMLTLSKLWHKAHMTKGGGGKVSLAIVTSGVEVW